MGRSWTVIDGHFSEDAHGRSFQVRTLMDGHISEDDNFSEDAHGWPF